MKYRVFHGFSCNISLKPIQWLEDTPVDFSAISAWVKIKAPNRQGNRSLDGPRFVLVSLSYSFFFSFMKGTLQQNEKNCLCVGDCRSWLPEMPSPKRVGYRIQHFPISNDLVTRIGVQPGTRKWCIISVYFELVTVLLSLWYFCAKKQQLCDLVP